MWRGRPHNADIPICRKQMEPQNERNTLNATTSGTRSDSPADVALIDSQGLVLPRICFAVQIAAPTVFPLPGLPARVPPSGGPLSGFSFLLSAFRLRNPAPCRRTGPPKLALTRRMASLSHRMGEGRGEGARFNFPSLFQPRRHIRISEPMIAAPPGPSNQGESNQPGYPNDSTCHNS